MALRDLAASVVARGEDISTALNWFEAGLVKRSEGHNVIARAAYNARERLVDERTNQVYDYRHLGEAEWKGVFGPEHAPDWAVERERLWNAVERREDQSTRPDQAQLARDFKIALPFELNAGQRLALTKDFAEYMAHKGMVVEVAIHAPHAHNDERNHHVHMLLTMREIGPDGFGNKVREWNQTAEFNRWTARWSELGGEHLERAGFRNEAERFKVGHLSRSERARLAHARGDMAHFEQLLNEPQRHRGPEASGMEKNGRHTRISEINREIEERNGVRGVLREIRAAYVLSADAETFIKTLEQKNMMLARITESDAQKCVVDFSIEERKYVPHYSEGQYVIATEQGAVYRLSTMTTGDSYKGLRDFTKPLNRQDYPSLEAAREELKKRSLIPKVDREEVIADLMRTPGILAPTETPARILLEQSLQNLAGQAEDLEGGALTYAEIKAIASGNPAVMEKVKVDTEIRKLDQLRSSHINQQHNIRWKVKSLPEQIERAMRYHAAVSADILTRDARADEDFTMMVGKREFSGKGAREEAGNALNAVVISWRDDTTPQVRGQFKGFEIVSRGSQFKDGEPDLFIRRQETYKANLNPDNPLGTIQSIEHTLRGLDRRAEEEQQEIERQEKALADYRAQLGRTFEHEARLRDLLVRQAQLNACLDLDKHEAQIVDESGEEEAASDGARRPPTTAQARTLAAKPPVLQN